jgi:hypothetical protein
MKQCASISAQCLLCCPLLGRSVEYVSVLNQVSEWVSQQRNVPSCLCIDVADEPKDMCILLHLEFDPGGRYVGVGMVDTHPLICTVAL